MPEYDGLLALDRLERAVEKVRDRLLRSTTALEAAGVPYLSVEKAIHGLFPLGQHPKTPRVFGVTERRILRRQTLSTVCYAVIGGNAVMAWVEQVDESAVRFTRDVDIVLRRQDLARATAALATAGFLYRHSAGMDMFLDGPEAKARDVVHVIFSGEKVRSDDPVAAPDTDEGVSFGAYRVLTLEALVRMKLTANRDKDKTHLRDMLEIGLIDATWPSRYPPQLAARLQQLIDTPEG